MKSLKLIGNLMLCTSFLFLFFIICLQGRRIEKLETEVADLRYADYALQQADSELDKKINETNNKCKRQIDTCIDILLGGNIVWTDQE